MGAICNRLVPTAEKGSGVREAIVDDESGASIGIVSLDDLVQNLAGDVAEPAAPEADEQPVAGRSAFH